MIDTIIFDMDGVICHTNPYHVQAFDAFFEKRNIPKPSADSYHRNMYGKSNSYIFSHYLGYEVYGDELARFENEKEQLFRDIYKSKVKPISGFLDFLKMLQNEGYKLGVATSAPRANMDLILDTLRIRDNFISTLASEDVTKHKPDPQVYLKSADKLGSLPATCLVFEDSYSGAMAGINAKMKVVGVLSSHTRDELPNCVDYISSFKKSLIENIRNVV